MSIKDTAAGTPKWFQNWWTKLASVVVFVATMTFVATIAYSNVITDQAEMRKLQSRLVLDLKDLNIKFEKEIAVLEAEDKEQRKTVQEFKIEQAIIQTKLDRVLQILENR